MRSCAFSGIHFAADVAVPIEEADFGVEIPAVVIKRVVFGKRRIESFDLVEILLLDVQKTNHNVGNLDAGVVDVVLDFDTIARGFQDVEKTYRPARRCVRDRCAPLCWG